MNTTIVYAFLAVALLSLAAFFKSDLRFRRLITLCILILTTTFMTEHVDEDGASAYLLISLSVAGVLNFALSYVKFFGKTWAALIPLFASLLLLYVPAVDSLTFMDVSIPWNTAKIFVIGAAGVLIYPVCDYVACHIKTLSGDATNERWLQSLQLALLGALVFVSMLFASFLGIFVLAVGYTLQSFYRRNEEDHVSYSLFALAVTGGLASLVELDGSNILFGKVMEGLFVGAFAVTILRTASASVKRKNLLTGIIFLLIIALSAGILMLVTQKADFGGVDAFVGIMVGFALVNAVLSRSLLASALFSAFMAIGLGMYSYTINREAEQMSQIDLSSVTGKNSSDKKDTKTEKEPDILDVEGQSLASLKGTKQVNPERSQLTFELGPKGGVTKGAFRKFSGSVKFSGDETPQFSMTFPVKELTTFVSMRDESLMSEAYFDEKKYPKMTFKSTGVSKEGDLYTVKGLFTMHGKTNEESISLKYLGKSEDGSCDVFVGKSTLDRTKYGMKSDPMEGDIVKFQFKLELK